MREGEGEGRGESESKSEREKEREGGSESEERGSRDLQQADPASALRLRPLQACGPKADQVASATAAGRPEHGVVRRDRHAAWPAVTTVCFAVTGPRGRGSGMGVGGGKGDVSTHLNRSQSALTCRTIVNPSVETPPPTPPTSRVHISTRRTLK